MKYGCQAIFFYSISESKDNEHGELFEYVNNEVATGDPVIQLVPNSMEVHDISAIKYSYNSESVRIWFAEDLENPDF